MSEQPRQALTEATSEGGESADWGCLTSALAADALDSLGYRQQCLGHEVRPLSLSQRVVGRAFPVHSIQAVDATPARPYEGLLSAFDAAPGGKVFVFETGRSDAAGVWGELITNACLAAGLAGALTDGLVRDVASLLDCDFPVFSRGATPYDSKGRIHVVAHDVPVVIDDVTIAPDDLIVGDADGVCVVPAALESAVIRLVRDKRAGEQHVLEAVRKGDRVSDAFHRFGVL